MSWILAGVPNVAREDRNNRPAPQRRGSAFAN
jgi:hypothetical protein